jgi:predicted lipoprotein with Yx(FWY)xxD motif
MKKSKVPYLLSVPLLLLALLLAACGEMPDGATNGEGGGGPGLTEEVPEVPTEGPLPEIGVTEEPQAGETEAPAGETPAATEAPAAEPPVAGGEEGITLQVEETDELGPILTDGEGMTLYMLEADQPGESTCTDACAELWPPVVISSDPEVGEQINTTLIGVIQRPDGDTQLTYNQHPLYYYEPDEAAGDVQGHQVSDAWGLWTVISPEGDPVTAGAGQGGG